MTAAARMDHAPDVSTISEQGVDLVFTNWRGFFGAPNLSETKIYELQDLLEKMYDTEEWEDIRQKRGWSNLYVGGDDFVAILKDQENEMGVLMDEERKSVV